MNTLGQEDGSAPSSLEASLPGQKLGHYRIESVIGRGGAGVVFQARDTHLGRRVAIKVLEERTRRQQEMFQRFVQEARLAAQLSHPNVVTIHEVNQDRTLVYIVMELLAGGSMEMRLQQEGRLDWSAATRAMQSVSRGLAAAHDRGLIHRDIKPGNILIDETGQAKLGDFGLARRHADPAAGLTTAGMVLGTPHYMSPEQCEGQSADRRSDFYSMGATFHALLTGTPPYPGDQPLQVAFAHCSAPPPDPCLTDESIPEACGTIVQRAMAKRPADRYQSAAELQAALSACLEEQTSSAPPSVSIETEPVHRLAPRQRASPFSLRQSAVAVASLSVVVLLGSLLTLGLVGTSVPETREVGRDDRPPSEVPPSVQVAPEPAAPPQRDLDALLTSRTLEALFEGPSRDEVRETRVRWKRIPTPAVDWRVERRGRMELTSQLLDGERQYTLLRYPDVSAEKFPVVIFCRGDQTQGAGFDPRALQMRFPAFQQFLMVFVVFRGDSFGWSEPRRVFESEGVRGTAITETTDLIATLDRLFKEIPQADPARVMVVGTGSRAAVAMQLGIRDPRVKGVIAADADVDGFETNIRQAVARAARTGTAPESRLAQRVWSEIARPLLNGDHELPEARSLLLGLSPARLAPYLPPTHVYFGAFSADYDLEQARSFRQWYEKHGRWQDHFVCRRLSTEPGTLQTSRTILRSMRPLVSAVIDGRLP